MKQNKTSKNKQTTRNKTIKREKKNNFNKLVKHMLELYMLIRIHHWNSYSYSKHKITDNLYDDLSKHIDKYIEVMLGKKYILNQSALKTLNIPNVPINKLQKKIKNFIRELNIFHSKLEEETYNDIHGIRDEIIADLHKYIYLLSMK